MAPQQGVLLKSSIVRVSKGGFVKTLVAVPLNNEEMQGKKVKIFLPRISIINRTQAKNRNGADNSLNVA